ncbi:MAG: hypothetical protein E6575_26560, partial [Bradyrhizobium sp.]|nr:hypothetical protein [Bradyrhizobium sp.]
MLREAPRANEFGALEREYHLVHCRRRDAEMVLDELNDNARSLRLMSDLNRNLLLLNQLYWQAGR